MERELKDFLHAFNAIPPGDRKTSVAVRAFLYLYGYLSKSQDFGAFLSMVSEQMPVVDALSEHASMKE